MISNSFPANPDAPQPAAAAGNHPSSLLLQAAAYAEAQDYDRAEAVYIAALEQAPDLAIARFQLGLLQLSSARPAVASGTWARLDRLDDRHPLKLFKRALECLALNEFDAAVRGLEQGIAANPENPALNRDMQRVIERVRQMRAGGKAAPVAGDTADAVPESASEAHFLVSAYRNLN
jgi:tetratricopeptide (TPR) repeat protein